MIEEETKNEIVKQVLNELKSKKLLNNPKSSYSNTEKILYSLNVLPEAVKLIKEEITKLEEEAKDIPPAPAKSNTLVLHEGENVYNYGDETLATRISELKQIVVKTNSQVRLVKEALKKFEDDEYYPIIESIYFERKTYSEIEDEFGWAVGTISKHRKRLINKLKVYIFPNTFMNELGD